MLRAMIQSIMEVCWSGVSVESDDSEHQWKYVGVESVLRAMIQSSVESDDSEHNGSMLEWSQC